jgi:hypothetical protein
MDLSSFPKPQKPPVPTPKNTPARIREATDSTRLTGHGKGWRREQAIKMAQAINRAEN